MNSDKHKMEKFLHAGRFSIASVFAPISFPPLPLIALKNMGEAASPVVAAVGSLKSIDPDRIILKKIILTGYGHIVLMIVTSYRDICDFGFQGCLGLRIIYLHIDVC